MTKLIVKKAKVLRW